MAWKGGQGLCCLLPYLTNVAHGGEAFRLARRDSEGAPGSAEVRLLGVGSIHHRLGVGDVVHSGDTAVDDAQILQNDLKDNVMKTQSPKNHLSWMKPVTGAWLGKQILCLLYSNPPLSLLFDWCDNLAN